MGLCATQYQKLLTALEKGFISHPDAQKAIDSDEIDLKHRIYELRRKGHRIITLSEGKHLLGYTILGRPS